MEKIIIISGLFVLMISSSCVPFYDDYDSSYSFSLFYSDRYGNYPYYKYYHRSCYNCHYDYYYDSSWDIDFYYILWRNCRYYRCVDCYDPYWWSYRNKYYKKHFIYDKPDYFKKIFNKYSAQEYDRDKYYSEKDKPEKYYKDSGRKYDDSYSKKKWEEIEKNIQSKTKEKGKPPKRR